MSHETSKGPAAAIHTTVRTAGAVAQAPLHLVAAATGQRPLGVDFDGGAGTVDWSALKSTGTSWVYCKATGGYSNTSSTFVDGGFSSYWKQAEQEGVTRGAYCFFDLNSDGLAQAQLFYKTVVSAGGFGAGDLPPALDIEWTTDPAGEPFPTGDSWKTEALEWLQYIEKKTGRLPIIYTNQSMAENDFDSRFAKYPLWVARYATCNEMMPTQTPPYPPAATQLGPWSQWGIWQYSESGIVSGMSGTQDLDVMGTSLKAFIKATTK